MADRVPKGMVFGVFDGLHEGHKHFLADAAARCGELVVVVAKDEAVRRIKGKYPKRPLSQRIQAIEALDPTSTVITGDGNDGEWQVLAAHKPDLIFLGYDQKRLAEEFKKLDIPYIFLTAHEPERFKSGILDR